MSLTRKKAVQQFTLRCKCGKIIPILPEMENMTLAELRGKSCIKCFAKAAEKASKAADIRMQSC